VELSGVRGLGRAFLLLVVSTCAFECKKRAEVG
jgi:hypothetical protein